MGNCVNSSGKPRYNRKIVLEQRFDQSTRSCQALVRRLSGTYDRDRSWGIYQFPPTLKIEKLYGVVSNAKSFRILACPMDADAIAPDSSLFENTVYLICAGPRPRALNEVRRHRPRTLCKKICDTFERRALLFPQSLIRSEFQEGRDGAFGEILKVKLHGYDKLPMLALSEQIANISNRRKGHIREPSKQSLVSSAITASKPQRP